MNGSAITSHPYVPEGQRFDVCAVCGLAEAAHARSVFEPYPSTICATCGADLADPRVANACDQCHVELERPA